MKALILWFAAAAIAVLVILGGLFLDAQVHIREHSHIVTEALLDVAHPLQTNPGHLVFGVGLIITSLAVLGGFTAAWLAEQPASQARRRLVVPAALWVTIGGVGLLTLFFLVQAA